MCEVGLQPNAQFLKTGPTFYVVLHYTLRLNDWIVYWRDMTLPMIQSKPWSSYYVFDQVNNSFYVRNNCFKQIVLLTMVSQVQSAWDCCGDVEFCTTVGFLVADLDVGFDGLEGRMGALVASTAGSGSTDVSDTLNASQLSTVLLSHSSVVVPSISVSSWAIVAHMSSEIIRKVFILKVE